MEDNYDHADLSEIEANLYAKIHHDSGSNTVEQYNVTNPYPDVQTNIRLVTNTSLINNATVNTQSGRYWSNVGNSSSNIFGGNKKNYSKERVNPFRMNNVKATAVVPSLPVINTVSPSDIRPKPYTPYTSYLSQIGTPIGISSASKPAATTITTTVPPNLNHLKNNFPAKKQLNPFNKLNESKKKRLQKLKVKKEKAANVRKNLVSKNNQLIVLYTTSEEEDDDEVICIPAPPPPLVYIEDSDEEIKQEPDYEQTTQTATNSESIQEDFIGLRDRNRISQCIDDDALGGIDDEELNYINATVESAIAEANRREAQYNDINDLPLHTQTVQQLDANQSNDNVSSKESSVEKADDVIFATPTRASSGVHKSYEMAENGFAAVDVYESESSDFPESSVYEKGNNVNRLQATTSNANLSSDSECSDIQINTKNRSKRMKKRKSSGSNKGSDYVPSENDDSEEEILLTQSKPPTTSTPFVPFIQHGEAVNNAKTAFDRKSNKKLRLNSEHQSDEDFLSVLSCIVHNTSDDEDNGGDSTKSLNDEPSSLHARSIVESVLNKIANKDSVKSGITDEDKECNEKKETHEMDAHSSNVQVEVLVEGKSTESAWIVKDQVGDTDDIFVPNIEPENEMLNIIDCAPNKNTEEPNKKGVNDNVDKQSVQSSSLVVDPEIGWTDEMKRFYNMSWGGEKHTTRFLTRNMPNDIFEWQISSDDKYPKRQRYNVNIRCLNCREMGHKIADCYKPPKVMKCHMCGRPGHREPRCPNTICLRCGNKTQVFSRHCIRCNAFNNLNCNLCKTRGHVSRDCPDRWRRYHSTIDNVKILNITPHIYGKPKSCCICSESGHTAEYCRSALRVLDYPVPPIRIQSYDTQYKPLCPPKIKFDDPPTAEFALLSTPNPDAQFAWNVNEQEDRFYGRIIKATNIKREPPAPPKIKKRTKKSNNVMPLIPKDDLPPVKYVLNPMTLAMQKKNKNIQFKKQVSSPEISSKELQVLDANEVNSENNLVDNYSTKTQYDIVVNEPLVENIASTEIEKTPETSLLNFSFSSAINELEATRNQSNVLMETNTPIKFDLSHISAGTENNPNITSDKIDNLKLPPECIYEEKSEINLSSDSILTNTPDNLKRCLPYNEQECTESKRPKNVIETVFNENQHSLLLLAQKEAEIEDLERREKMLMHLRDKIKRSKPSSSTQPINQYHVELNEDLNQCSSSPLSSNVNYDSDSNYSFSEYFNKSNNGNINSNVDQHPTRKDPVEFAPDFIPLSNDNFSDPKDVNEHMDLSDEYLADVAENVKCEAKIHLTKEYSKYLLSKAGNEFLRKTYIKHDVIVRMEWREYGNVLIVIGCEKAQEKFHTDLIKYCKSAEEEIRKKNEISQMVPKNRDALIKFIRDQICQLDKPLGNAKEIYYRMTTLEKMNTKNGLKQADRIRRALNMILMGQTGLREGAVHLTSLQQNLRVLINLDKSSELVSKEFRNEVFHHFRYIFSSHSHNDYQDLINQYDSLKKNKKLPILNLDRKLIGLSLNASIQPEEDEEDLNTKEITKESDLTQLKETSAEDYTEKIKENGKAIVTVKMEIKIPPPPPPINIAANRIRRSDQHWLSSTLNDICVKQEGYKMGKGNRKNEKDGKSQQLWSKKCEEIIKKYQDIPKVKANTKVMAKIGKILSNARRGLLGFKDYKALCEIFEKII